MTVQRHKPGGYIALISAIIISLILMGLTFAASSSGYTSRFNVADSGYKRMSLGLAESCVNIVLLHVAEDYRYTLAPTEALVLIGSEHCLIKSLTYGPEVAGEKHARILTQASYHGAWTNLEVVAAVLNPAIQPTHLSIPPIVISSWIETPVSGT